MFRGKYLIILKIVMFISSALSMDIQKAFEDHGVVKDVLEVAPSSLLKILYPDNVEVKGGNELKPVQVKEQPIIEKWTADDDAFYTLMMVDPDAPSRENPKAREFKHWLVINIPGNDLERGDVIAAYVGAGPPKDTGLHRYVFLLFKQPTKIEYNEERVGNNSRNGRPKFKAAQFAKKYNLGDPIAGNFYQAAWDEYVPLLHQQLSGN